MNQNRPTPEQVARELYETRYHGAAVVFAAGSFRRGEATATSDIDLVVVYPKLENAYRESYFHKGWPVEAFVHDPETLNYFFHESDAKTGIPSLPNMIVGGIAIPDAHPFASDLKCLADDVLGAGPSKYSEEQLKHARYGISDLLDDLRSPRNSFEMKALAAKLHEELGNFWFRAQGLWSASGKHIPRRMCKLDAGFADRWVKVFDQAFIGDVSELLKLTEEILNKHGGYTFEGVRRDAPKDWKLPLKPTSTEIPIPVIESGLTADEKIWHHDKLGKIDVRLGELKDVRKIRELLNAAYKRLADMGLNFNATFMNEALTAEGLTEGRSFVLAQGDEILATMKVTSKNHIDSRKCLYVGRFAVQPKLQGEGLGLFLLKVAEKLAQREGCVCTQLDTAQPAEHLVQFYQKQGYQIIRPIYFEGKTYLSWVFQKEIK